MGGKKIVTLIFAILLTLLISLLMLQERFIFYPEKLSPDYEYPYRNAQEINFDFQGLQINSLLFEAKSSPLVILYFHGNAGSLGSWGDVASEICEKSGHSVWILDYPGYGKSDGKIRSEKQLLDLAATFLTQARAKFPNKQFIIYGRSIGSGPAAWLASEEKLPLILESPFTSLTKLSSELFPWFPVFLKRYAFDSLTRLEKFQEPLLIVHGANDEIIPVAHSKSIAEKIDGTHLEIIPGAHHNDLALHPQYWVTLRRFFNETF